MPAKIRLARHGQKGNPHYHIVVADSRAPRDGRFIERIGYYNPGTIPATIVLDFDKALDWLRKGAQPTDTCRAILSYKGVLYKNHLLKGVQKGAFSEEDAEKRFTLWLEEKESKIEAKRERVKKGKDEEKKKRLAVEAKINQSRAEEIAKKTAALADEAARTETATKKAEEEIPAAPLEAVAEEPADHTQEAAETGTGQSSAGEEASVNEEKPAAEEEK